MSTVRIREDDIERLQQGYKLTREQAFGMVRRSAGEFIILMEKTAACPALASKGGRYLCQAYEHRPGICRDYECHILAFAKDWLKKRNDNEEVAQENPFRSALDEQELGRQVQSAIQRMRTDFLNLCVKHQKDEDFRKPDHIAELIKTLSGAEFQNTFPPLPG